MVGVECRRNREGHAELPLSLLEAFQREQGLPPGPVQVAPEGIDVVRLGQQSRGTLVPPGLRVPTRHAHTQVVLAWVPGQPALPGREGVAFVPLRLVQHRRGTLGGELGLVEPRERGLGRAVELERPLTPTPLLQQFPQRHERAVLHASRLDPPLEERERAVPVPIREEHLGLEEHPARGQVASLARPQESLLGVEPALLLPVAPCDAEPLVLPSRTVPGLLRRLAPRPQGTQRQGGRVVSGLDGERRDQIRNEGLEARVHLLRRGPQLALEGLVQVQPLVECLEQSDHRSEALLVDQHLAQQAALVVAEQDP